MDGQTAKTIAVYDRPFRLPGFDETLPAGEYDIETELASPPDHKDPQAWKTSVVVHLHPRLSHPGLTRSLSVSLADLDLAVRETNCPERTSHRSFSKKCWPIRWCNWSCRQTGCRRRICAICTRDRGRLRLTWMTRTLRPKTRQRRGLRGTLRTFMTPRMKGCRADRALHPFLYNVRNAISGTK